MHLGMTMVCTSEYVLVCTLYPLFEATNTLGRSYFPVEFPRKFLESIQGAFFLFISYGLLIDLSDVTVLVLQVQLMAVENDIQYF